MSPELIAILAVGVALMALNLTIARFILRHVDQRIDRLEDRIDHLETRFDRLEDRVDRLNSRVDDLSKETARIGGLLDGLREAIYGRATSV